MEPGRREAMAHYRRERAPLYGSFTGSGMPTALGSYLAMGFSGVMLLVLTPILIAMVALGGSPPVQLVGVDIFGFVVFAAGLAMVLVKRRGARRWKASLEQLARKVQGSLAKGLSPALQWFDKYWAGPIDGGEFLVSASCSAMAMTCRDYAVLLVSDPHGVPRRGRAAALVDDSMLDRDPKLHIFVASWLPAQRLEQFRARQLPGRAAELDHGFTLQGFGLSVDRAGLHLKASPVLMAAYGQAPEALSDLTGAIETLAEMAQELGGQPVGPIE